MNSQAQTDIFRIKRERAMERLNQNREQMRNEQPTKPNIIVKVSPDKMEATLLLHPTSLNTSPPVMEDLTAALEQQGVVYGVNGELLEDLCARPVYYHVFTIARGVPETVGENGYINYKVAMTRNRMPKIAEDGTADFKNIDYFQIVKKGDTLCEIVFAQRGEDGMDVLGNQREGRFGTQPIDPTGKNTELNEDRTVLTAAIDGHVEVQYGIVHVIEVLTVDGVDNSTGNINFVGDVIIKGDVAPGFSITAGGSIEINGNVESADLRAGTDIKVNAGMFGMDKGQVFAGGSIKCRFIQNCHIKNTGNITAESILYSNVECDGDIELVGNKAAVIGGRVILSGKLTAKTIGSKGHVPTEIIINAEENDQLEQLDSLRGRMAALDGEIGRIVTQINQYELRKRSGTVTDADAHNIVTMTNSYPAMLQEREEAENSYNRIIGESLLRLSERCYVEVRGQIHPNTRVKFGKLGYKVDSPLTRVRIHNGKDGVAVSPLP